MVAFEGEITAVNCDVPPWGIEIAVVGLMLTPVTATVPTVVTVNVVGDSLLSAGLPPTTIQLIGDMINYDLYDVLAELGYGLNPRTKRQRVDAFKYKHEEWLDMLPDKTRKTVKAIAEQFAEGGTEGLESQYILQVPAVQQAGGAAALQDAGKPPVELLRETKERMFAA